MINKKAMSTVVTTVILVALVLIVLGVIWAIISGLIGEQTSGIDLRSRCLEISVAPIAANCDTVNCNITVRRAAGGGAFDALTFVFYRADGTTGTPVEVAGNVAPLATRVIPNTGFFAHGLVTPAEKPVKVDVYATIETPAGPQVCPQFTTRQI